MYFISKTGAAVGFLLSSMIVLTGCGGGGGSTPVKSQITIETNAKGIAYAVNGESWTTKVGEGEDIGKGMKRYTIDHQGKYRVALSCGSTVLDPVYLFNLTTHKEPLIHLKCPNDLFIPKLSVKGNISDAKGASDGYVVAMDTDYDIIQGTSGQYQVYAAQNSTFDLIAVSFQNQGIKSIPQRFYIERDISLPTLNDKDIVFTTENSAAITGKTFGFENGTSGSMYLITENNTYFTSQMDQMWYYPQKLLTQNDLYLIYAKYSLNHTYYLDTVTATKIKKVDIRLDASYIMPLTQITYQNNGTLGGWKHYHPSGEGYPLQGYLFTLFNTATPQMLYVMISKDYIEDMEEYTLEDISYLDHFENTWWGDNAKEVDAMAVMSHIDFSHMLAGGRYVHLKDTKIFLVPDSTIEVAEQKVK
jgi:hypothetical protein